MSPYERELTEFYVADPGDVEVMLRLRDCYLERSTGFAALSFNAQQVALATLAFSTRLEPASADALADVLEWDVDDVRAAMGEINALGYALVPV